MHFGPSIIYIVWGHLGCLQFFSVVSNAVINICIKFCFFGLFPKKLLE